VETNTSDGETVGQGSQTPVSTGSSGTGLDSNVAGALAYVLGIVTGIIMFVVEPDDEFVRFHAAQSIAVFGLMFVVFMALSIVQSILTVMFVSIGGVFAAIGGLITLVLSLVWMVASLASLALWVYLMWKAYEGETPRIPVAAGIADQLV
jgi:uncharacterized membrane protein